MSDSVFWNDLAEDMKDPEFAAIFQEEMRIINETDRIVNEYLEEGNSGEVYSYW